ARSVSRTTWRRLPATGVRHDGLLRSEAHGALCLADALADEETDEGAQERVALQRGPRGAGEPVADALYGLGGEGVELRDDRKPHGPSTGGHVVEGGADGGPAEDEAPVEDLLHRT